VRAKKTKKACFCCARLGNCADADIEKLKNQKGCGSWFAAHPKQIEARARAISIVGRLRAYEEMLLDAPPKPNRR